MDQYSERAQHLAHDAAGMASYGPETDAPKVPGDVARLDAAIERYSHQLDRARAILDPVIDPSLDGPRALQEQVDSRPQSQLANRADQIEELTSRLSEILGFIRL